MAVGIAGFVIAGALWWNYFDITASHSAHELQDRTEDHGNDDGATVDERHDLFVYGHLPLTAGIVIAGVGIKDLVLHPAATLPSAGGWTLAGGMALYLIGAAVILGGTRRAWRAAWPWPTAAIPVVLGAALIPHHTALLLVAGLGITSVTLAILGTARSRAR